MVFKDNQKKNFKDQNMPNKLFASVLNKNENKIPGHLKVNSSFRIDGLFNRDSPQQSDEDATKYSRLASTHELGRMLLQSAKDGNLKMVEEVMKKGAPFTSDWLGMSSLHFAAMNNHKSICDILLRGGVSKDGKTKVDRTPLHFAAYEGHEDIVKLLLERKCDPNIKDMLKMTPLHWAIEKKHKNIAKLLISYNADVNIVSKFKKTPISMAIESGQLDLLEELNIAKEKQNLKKSLMDALNNEAETQKAINSISTKSEEINTLKSNDTSNEKSVFTITNITTDDSENGDEKEKFVEPILQPENMSEDSTDESILELFKSHGISMLPLDDPATSLLTSAIRSGRSIVLSEAGKRILNDTKLHQNQIKTNENDEAILKNDLNKLKPENKLENIEKEKNENQVFTSKEKKVQLTTKKQKNASKINISAFKKMYAKEILKSLEKFGYKENEKHIITNITRISDAKTNAKKQENNTKRILNKELEKNKVSERAFIKTIDNEEDSNIEICMDDTVSTSSLVENECESENNAMSENDLALDEQDYSATKTSSRYSVPYKKIILNKSPSNFPSILNNRSACRRYIQQYTKPTIKNQSSRQRDLAMQKMDISEIFRQLHYLKKQVKELKQCNEEYRLRLDKLESQ